LIYACKAKATPPVPIWSDDLRAGTPPAWMIELAEQVKLIDAGGDIADGRLSPLAFCAWSNWPRKRRNVLLPWYSPPFIRLPYSREVI
jgi:hypothetical protein